MEIQELQQLITTKHIENVDLSGIDLNGLDFSTCLIENVSFVLEGQQNREFKNINFKNARLINVSFEGALIEDCDFDGSESLLKRVSFKKCKISQSRFRGTTMMWCDFRYSEIHAVTLEDAKIDFCDFYRAFFVGVVIFRKSKIANSSLYYTYFDEGATLRKENLANGKLLQQDKIAYRKFLVDWNIHGTGPRKNEQNRESDWKPDKSLETRFDNAEDIYKTLNGLWMSKGFIGDANWAYVKGKKMERRRMIAELSDPSLSWYQKAKNVTLILWNFICDAMFGYGESMFKMVASYILIIFLFAYFYYASKEVSLPNYTRAIGISLKNMVAMSSDEVSNVSPLIDFLNIIQTTIGILITGIFGFILGNKIRNQ
ncbi:MAG: pentapeptide repeat-containing protein [Bacteroidales bacterium]|jgi:hypothetical protein|nr:pentapeptide repeat-containing protein [Bacteroidales bacterium]